MTLRIGHRGAAGTHPENTMASFNRAIELGAQGVEFDIHRTRDGHLVVLHDHDLSRTTNGTGMVMEKSLAELKALDAGAWKGEQFRGERIPTLQELIRQTPPSLRLFLELKAGSIHYKGIEEELLGVIREEGAMERIQVSSFDHVALARLHELEPQLDLGMLFDDNPVDPLAMARACGATALHPYFLWTTPQMVAAAHAAGMKVNVWTVNEPPYIAIMKQIGVDGIMSDYPDRI